jgi:hypothetical protein
LRLVLLFVVLTGCGCQKGATGMQGPRGASGATGPAGAMGAMGAMGATGAMGTAGAMGPAGNGVTTDFDCQSLSGVKCDGTTDDTSAINACLASVGKSGGVALLPTGHCVITSTINVPSSVTLKGQCGGHAYVTLDSAPVLGTVLQWSSAASGSVAVSFFDVGRSALSCVSIENSANAPLSTGLLYSSDNHPASSQNDFGFFSVLGFHWGMRVGEASESRVTDCIASGDNNPGCYEMDLSNIHDCLITGPTAAPFDSSAEAIHVNSANALQQSAISNCVFKLVNLGTHIVTSNGGLRIERVILSSPAPGGVDPTLLKFESTVISSPDLYDIETEGKLMRYAVHDSSCNPYGTPGTPNWIGNQFQNNLAEPALLVDGCEHIFSVGNQAVGAHFLASGSAIITSLNESVWQTDAASSAMLYTWTEGVLASNEIKATNRISVGDTTFGSAVEAGDLQLSRPSGSKQEGFLWLGSDGNSVIGRTRGGGVYMSPALSTGSANMRDQGGVINVAANQTSASYSFTFKSYTSPPVCVVTPQADPTAIGSYWITVTPTTMTINQKTAIATNFAYNYVCLARD